VDVVEPASLRDRVAADLTAIFARRQLKHSWSG
jgi:hypothetical protein